MPGTRRAPSPPAPRSRGIQLSGSQESQNRPTYTSFLQILLCLCFPLMRPRHWLSSFRAPWASLLPRPVTARDADFGLLWKLLPAPPPNQLPSRPAGGVELPAHLWNSGPHLVNEANDLPPEPGRIQSAEVVPVQGDGARCGVIEPFQECSYRGLPCGGERRRRRGSLSPSPAPPPPLCQAGTLVCCQGSSPARRPDCSGTPPASIEDVAHQPEASPACGTPALKDPP